MTRRLTLALLILALSGVPGVVAGGGRALPSIATGRQPITALAAPSSRITVFAPLGRSDTPKRYPSPATNRIASIVAPESEIGTAIYTASATWCAPTPDKCQGWGGNARLAAVNSFTWGDEPYPVRVWRGEMYVDVTVVSHCGCFGEDGYIDMSPSAFELLAPLGIGRIDVEVEVLTDLAPHPDDDRMRVEDGGPSLPQTDAL